MRVLIDYTDGQYKMYRILDTEYVGHRDVANIDERDWKRYEEFESVKRGWDQFIHDMDETNPLHKTESR